MRFYEFRCRYLWRVELVLKRPRCWFVGHHVEWGGPYNFESDYCTKCHQDWPQDLMTLPKYLTRCYVWVVEREWRWFDRLDDWLFTNHQNWLPDWWENQENKMFRYCHYCGYSYTEFKCLVCGILFETCMCESGTTCEECAELEDVQTVTPIRKLGEQNGY